MELATEKPGVVGGFDNFNVSAVGSFSGDFESGGDEYLLVIAVEFVPMAVAFANLKFAVGAVGERTLLEHARPRAQAHRAAHFVHAKQFAQLVNDAVGSGWIELGAIGMGQSYDIARIFDGGALHAQTNSEVGHLAFARILNGVNHSLNAALAEASGDEDSIHVGKPIDGSCRRIQLLSFYPFDHCAEIVSQAAVHQRFAQTLVGVA